MANAYYEQVECELQKWIDKQTSVSNIGQSLWLSSWGAGTHGLSPLV